MSNDSRLPPLNGLRAFEAAGRRLTFRAAAEELGVTQGAVAQQVRGLEAQLGIALFRREARGLALTDEGRSYHGAVSRAFETIADATARLRPGPRKVTISVTPTFASKWLIPRLPEFAEAVPEVDLQILATERVSSFQSDGIDLAVRQGKPPFGASLRADLLFRQDIVAVMAPGLAPGLAPEGGRPLGLEDLSALTLLHDTHGLWPRFLRAAFGVESAPPGKAIWFNQTTLSLDAALAGQGVALASAFLVARDLEAGRLRQASPVRLAGEKPFYLLAPRTGLSPAAEAVRRWLLRIAEAKGERRGEPGGERGSETEASAP